MEGGAEVAEGATPTKKKRRLVRRKKKKAVEEIDVPAEDQYPDLDMLDADLTNAELEEKEFEEERLRNQLRAERLERLSDGEADATAADVAAPAPPDWFTASEEDVAAQVLDQNKPEPAVAAFEDNRFQAQMSAEAWNSQIMENEDELAPLSMVMKRLAILEDEKNSADRLLEEEYQKKMGNEDKYYLEKRRVLEDAITEIQEGVYSKDKQDNKEKSPIADKVMGDEKEEEDFQEGAHNVKAGDTGAGLLEKENDAIDDDEEKVGGNVMSKSKEVEKEAMEKSNATSFSA